MVKIQCPQCPWAKNFKSSNWGTRGLNMHMRQKHQEVLGRTGNNPRLMGTAQMLSELFFGPNTKVLFEDSKRALIEVQKSSSRAASTS